MKRRWTSIILFITGLFGPRAAEAHMMSTGMGPLYDGAAHMLLSPEELFPLLALALAAGLQGPIVARRLSFLAPWGWLVGGVAGAVGMRFPADFDAVATAALFMLAGGMLALARRAPPAAIVGVGVAAGVILGVREGASLQPGHTWLPLLGVTLSVFVVTALAASMVLPLKTLWMRLAIRYLGSCSAALGLLLLGWAIKLSGGAR